MLNLKDAVEQFERQHILRALEYCNWNQSKSAQCLNLSRQALQYKLYKYGLTEKQLDPQRYKQQVDMFK